MSERTPERLELVDAGVATSENAGWPGGKGTAVCTIVGSMNANLQALIDAVWVNVKDVNGTVIVLDAVEMHNFELPQCRLRVNGTLTGGTVRVVGIG
jgi:hypothetical protein